VPRSFATRAGDLLFLSGIPDSRRGPRYFFAPTTVFAASINPTSSCVKQNSFKAFDLFRNLLASTVVLFCWALK
jgi:hypothetical protein